MRTLICILLFSILPIYADEILSSEALKVEEQVESQSKNLLYRVRFSFFNTGLETRGYVFPFGIVPAYDYFFTPVLFNFNNTPDMKPGWNLFTDIYAGSFEENWMKYTIDFGFLGW